MKQLAIMAAITMALSTSPVLAGSSISQIYSPVESQVQHGGGCRKNSPPNQCCHAGSKPYHCH